MPKPDFYYRKVEKDSNFNDPRPPSLGQPPQTLEPKAAYKYPLLCVTVLSDFDDIWVDKGFSLSLEIVFGTPLMLVLFVALCCTYIDIKTT